MDEADIRDPLLFWLIHATREWQSIPSASFPRNASGNLLNERVRMSRDGWVKPNAREWARVVWDGEDVFANLSNKLRRRITNTLWQMELDGLVELIMAENRRILWVRLTDHGTAIAENLNELSEQS